MTPDLPPLPADITAIRDALAEVRFYKAGGFSYNAQDFHIAANPQRIARLLDALESAQKDAERWRWISSHPIVMDDYAFSVDDEVVAFVDAAMKDAP